MNALERHALNLAVACVNDLDMVSCISDFDIPVVIQSHGLTIEFDSRLTFVSEKIFLTPRNRSLDEEVQRHFGFWIPHDEFNGIVLTVFEAVRPDEKGDWSISAKNFSSYQDLKAWIDDFHQKFVDAFLDTLIQKKYIKPNLGRPKGLLPCGYDGSGHSSQGKSENQGIG